MKKKEIRKFLLYIARWEASTPVLALCLFLLSARLNEFWATVIANLIGGCIFYAVDKRIFKK